MIVGSSYHKARYGNQDKKKKNKNLPFLFFFLITRD